MTYTNIQRIACLFHYFFHTKLIPKPPGLLLCSLSHHYIRPPHPRHRCLASCRPCVLCRDARQKKRHKRHTSGGCWHSSPPSQAYFVGRLSFEQRAFNITNPLIKGLVPFLRVCFCACSKDGYPLPFQQIPGPFNFTTYSSKGFFCPFPLACAEHVPLSLVCLNLPFM